MIWRLQMVIKYKVNEVAKDLNVDAKSVIAVINDYLG
jgi:hypothetical protein